MAQRRMFSPDIICSEEFLEMPVSCRDLYIQLAIRADDDGFIQPKIVMRMIGSDGDDLKILIAKRFLLAFDDGVVVIKHWLIHNIIRSDRYKATRFQEQKKMLQIKDNKSYTELGLQNDNQMATQVRLGKDRIGEKESVEDSAPLSEKNLKPKPNSPRGWANLRREEIGKPPIRTPRSEKQVETFEALKWKDYFRDQGYEQHGMQFFKVESKKRESAVSILILKASKEVEDMKKLIDWWFEGNGEWAQYEPEQCFMGKTLERFINKGKGTKQNKPLSL